VNPDLAIKETTVHTRPKPTGWGNNVRRLRALLRRPDLGEVLAARVAQPDTAALNVQEVVEDAVLRQDMRWLEDELAGRPSVI